MEPKETPSDDNIRRFLLYHMVPGPSVRVFWLMGELGISNLFSIFPVALSALPNDYQKKFQEEARKKTDRKGCEGATLAERNSKGEIVAYMVDTADICLFLVKDIVPGSTLKPTSVPALGRYDAVIGIAVSSIDPLLNDIDAAYKKGTQKGSSKNDVPPDAVSKFGNIVAELDQILSDCRDDEFICYPHHPGFTVADVIVGYSLYRARSLGFKLPPSLEKYLQRLEARQHFKNAFIVPEYGAGKYPEEYNA